MMRTILRTLVLSLIPFSLTAQTKSLLWEISGNGLEKPSYLYGTMHVSDKIAFHLTDSFFIALKSADVVALESNPEHWIENDFGNPDKSTNYTYGEYDAYNSGYNNYGSDFYTQATEIFIPDTRTYYSAYADNSWLINGYLYRYSDPRGDYAEETYLDLFIFQCGKKLAKQIAPLEKEQEVLNLLQKAYEEPEEDKKDEENAEFMEQERIRAALEEDDKSIYDMIDEAYRDGDLDRLDSLEIVSSPSRRFRKYFIEDRNRNMVRRMDSIMRSGQIIFTGIGAAHLPGQYGAIKLLREMGYTVRPVQGKVTNKSIKEKDKIDAIYYAQPTNVQYAYDSLYTITSPGKLYEIGGYQTNSFVLYPDMANSAYYAVIRVAHHAHLRNKTPQDVLQEIDDMLYESIPGDIVSKTAIKGNNGWPGFDIVSKTKRGSYLRFKIFVSPLETIIFKASGIGEFVIKSKEMEAFFSSIKFKEQEAEPWTTYTPQWGGFSLSTPAERIAQSIPQGASVSGFETIATGEAAQGNDRYFFTAYMYHDDNFIEEDSFELVRLTDMFAEQFKKQDYKNNGYIFNTVQGHPSAESVWKNHNGYLHAKAVVNGPYYILLSAFTSNEQRPDKYFNSISLNDFVYTKPFEVYTDTALYFSVNTIFPAPDTLLTLDEIEYGSQNNFGYDYSDDEEELDDSYLADTKLISFSSETTPENVYVQYHKYHDYSYYKSKETFWNSFDSTYAGMDGYTLTRRIYTDKDSIQSLEFLLTDTASTRGVYKKFIQKDNALFHLSTCIDTIDGPSLFIRNFYDSFTPSDSVRGRSIFDSPADKFFSALTGDDSVPRKQAIRSVNVVNLNNSDAERLIKYIESPAFKSLKMDERSDFINALSDLNSPLVVPALRKVYMDAGDSTTLQTTVLNALSEMHTQEATKTFLELLYVETPLAQKGYSLGWLFTDFNDTLALGKKLFPQLFDFTTFPEYQYPTYRLLASLLIEDSTNIRLYAEHSKQIITQASAELKRNLSNDDEEDEDNYSYNDYYNNNYFTKLSDITESSKEISVYFFGTDAYADSEHGGDQAWDSDAYYYDDDAEGQRYSWASSLQDYYSILLTPYYKDPAVKKYFDRILKCKDQDLVLSTALTMLEAGLPVPDSVFRNMQKDRSTRYEVIEALTEMNRKDKIDSVYGNQRMLTEGFLYQYEFSKEEDSIQYITRREVETEEGSGYVYFYKSKMGKDKGWSLDCTGVQPSDTTTFEIEPLFVHYGGVILDDEDMEEKIDEIIRNIELLGRARVSITFDDNTNNGYWDEY